MTKCSFCNCQASAELGRNYCQDHLGKYEEPILSSTLPSSNKDLINSFYLDCFNTLEPKFSMVPLLYDRFPSVKRGVWLNRRKCFSKSQELYLAECFCQWLVKGGD